MAPKRSPRTEHVSPATFAHQKLLTTGKGPSELARMTGASKSTCQDWLVKGTVADRKYQDALRAQLGIQWADWQRKPAPPEPITPEEQSAAIEVEIMRPCEEQSDEEEQVQFTPEEGKELQALLEDVRRQMNKAAPGSQASSGLTAQYFRILGELRKDRLAQQTERDRIMSSPLLQGMARCAMEVLRGAMGDDWSEAVRRIEEVWDQLDENGQLPEGVNADGS